MNNIYNLRVLGHKSQQQMIGIWMSQALEHNLLCSSTPFFLVILRKNEIWILYISHSKSKKKGRDEAKLIFIGFAHFWTWRRWMCIYRCRTMGYNMVWGALNSLTSKSLFCDVKDVFLSFSWQSHQSLLASND